MKKIMYTTLLCVGLVLIAGIGLFAGYSAFAVREEKPVAIPLENSISKALDTPKAESNEDSVLLEPEDDSVKVNADTQIIFEYYYEEDGTTKRQTESLPYFMVDKTQDDFLGAFNQWEVIEFTPEQVILRRVIEKVAKQGYRVSVMDGYIAVYYNDALDGSKLKEITDTPISSLPSDEQERLLEGVEVDSEESLMRLLEDLSS